MTLSWNDQMAFVAKWAAAECQRQRSGEASVSWMVDGWLFAADHPTGYYWGASDVLKLARIVEPRRNDGVNFRQYDVVVGYEKKGPWQEVPRLMADLMDLWFETDLKDDDWFRRYEDIHPLGDGNGRTGSILWNLRRGSIEPSGLADAPWFEDWPSPVFDGASVREWERRLAAEMDGW